MSMILPMAGSTAQEHHDSLELLVEQEGCQNPSLQLIVVITIVRHQTDSALRYVVQIGTKPDVFLEIFLMHFATWYLIIKNIHCSK